MSVCKNATALQVVQGVAMAGKTVLITGANNGIGFETARALASAGATLVMACRNLKAAEEAKDRIQTEIPNAQIEVVRFDAGDLSSVQTCATSITRPLNVLIHNAGVWIPNEPKTKDGIDSTFQINHLAPFYLTHLLAKQLAAGARVVVVSSKLHKGGLTPSNTTAEHLSPATPAGGTNAYSMSKMCNILFASELNRRLAPMNMTAVSLHPGVVRTDLGRGWWLLRLFYSLPGWITQTIGIEQGAATSVYCATAADIQGGEYYDECKVKEPAAPAKDVETAGRLWSVSEKMLRDHGFEFESIPASK